MRYGKRKWSATGTEMPSNISRMMERIGGAGGGVGKGLGKPSGWVALTKQAKGGGSPLRKGQQDTGGGGYSTKSGSLKNQKVTKKKKKNGDTWEQDAQKNKELRDKRARMEAEGRQNMREQQKMKEKYGDWLDVSKKAVKKRIKKSKMVGRTRTKKKKGEEQELWTPPPIEGIPRPKKK